MTAIALKNDAQRYRDRTTSREDRRLAVARERLRNCRSLIATMTAVQRDAVLAYDGPEVSGSMRSKRRDK